MEQSTTHTETQMSSISLRSTDLLRVLGPLEFEEAVRHALEMSIDSGVLNGIQLDGEFANAHEF